MDVVIELKDDPTRPAYQRLAEAIREGILSGRFRPGEKLPPTRSLATALKLARNTVLEAYEQLTAEGYLAARHGSGTFVAPDLPDRAFHAPQARQVATNDPPSPPPRALSAFGRRILDGEVWSHIRFDTHPTPFEFRYGMPSVDEFPIDAWRTLTKRVLDYPPNDLMGYGLPEGLPQ
ncbi:MAG TPA: GntR family transcriptional regulator, partial [Tepidiformaceae bacterium]|nr:GntR family transcriptional regulator [Tepidiformaceae bacterium]